MWQRIRQFFGIRKPTLYCECGAEAVYPQKEPKWCEFCYPAVWRRQIEQALYERREEKL